MAPQVGIDPTTGQSIDLGKAKQAAARIDHAHDVISGLRLRLQGHHDALQRNWKSSASMKFKDVFEAFDGDFQHQLDALADMHQKLIKTHAHYESSVQQQNEAVNRVHDLINNAVNHAGTAQ
jgi:WXG100 family type VII secretion target